jgi:hypothetical protein
MIALAASFGAAWAAPLLPVFRGPPPLQIWASPTHSRSPAIAMTGITGHILEQVCDHLPSGMPAGASIPTPRQCIGSERYATSRVRLPVKEGTGLGSLSRVTPKPAQAQGATMGTTLAHPHRKAHGADAR